MDKTDTLWGDRFWQGGTNFGCQKWSGRTDFGSKNWFPGPVLAGFSAKIGSAGPILGGTDFGVTAQPYMYSVVNYTISDLDCDDEKAVTFFGSAGFIAPLIILLL